MFSAPKEKVQVAPAPPIEPKRPALPASMPSIISANLTIEGELYTAGELQIDGRVDGDIGAGVLVIGEKAIIHGDVLAAEATVRGHVKGQIRARKLTLCATCHVEGSILYQTLSIETGAFYEGDCRPSKDPLVPVEQLPKPGQALTAQQTGPATPQRPTIVDARPTGVLTPPRAIVAAE